MKFWITDEFKLDMLDMELLRAHIRVAPLSAYMLASELVHRHEAQFQIHRAEVFNVIGDEQLRAEVTAELAKPGYTLPEPEQLRTRLWLKAGEHAYAVERDRKNARLHYWLVSFEK